MPILKTIYYRRREMRKCHHVTTNQSGIFHGFYQFSDGEYSGPVAVVELSDGIIDCWMAERTVFEDAPQDPKEENEHVAQQLKLEIAALTTELLGF
jgi:hypothetical protein